MAARPFSSVAIAGAWGYIGRKFLDAAVQLNLATSVFDTGPPPADLELEPIAVFDSEAAFYQQRADLFHLALHPEQRAMGLAALLHRSQGEPIRILCEKPMALPESPDECRALVESIGRSQAIVLYDYPELFDPITTRIKEFLGQFDQVQVDSIAMQRSKDREDPAIARNAKRMVHIQYQESVHCLAFAVNLLACVHGGLEPVFSDGARVAAHSRPYRPPNPADYRYVVDGRCEYEITLGATQINGLTDFTRGAPWAKRRVIKGRGDGQPFVIQVDFLEGQKLLEIDGQPHNDVVATDSYAATLQSIDRLCQCQSVGEVMSGLNPTPAFAHVTYQLSSLLWKSSWEETPVTAKDLSDLLAFDAHFADAVPRFDRY